MKENQEKLKKILVINKIFLTISLPIMGLFAKYLKLQSSSYRAKYSREGKSNVWGGKMDRSLAPSWGKNSSWEGANDFSWMALLTGYGPMKLFSYELKALKI